MFKKILSLLLAIVFVLSIVGCSKNDKEQLSPSGESTIIKNAKSANDFIKKNDLKSIAYAFVYNIHGGINSYKLTETGTLSSKILFIDYLIDTKSVTIKNNNVYFTKTDSESTLKTVHNEYYQNDNTRILVSKDLKNYNVMSMEDYHKTSFTSDQYLISGYVFNDKSIVNSELLSNTKDEISIKYTLDKDAATAYAKQDMKTTGDLTDYPTFTTLEITLHLKDDLTPLYTDLYAVYNASVPVIGTATVVQKVKSTYSNINENLVIPNESFYTEKIGQAPITPAKESEVDIKTQLLNSASNLGFDKGVNIDGKFSIDLMGASFALDINTSTLFDIKRLNDEYLYNLFNFHATLKGNETFNGLIGIIKSFAGDKLGEYGDLIDNFAGIEVSYLGDGSFYLLPFNSSGKYYTVFKVKLVDILDLVISKLNVYKMLNDSQNDIVTFTKSNSVDEKNYSVDVVLNEDTVKSMKKGLEDFFNTTEGGMLKAMLQYADFGSLKIKLDVVDDKISKLTASFSYMKNVIDSTTSETKQEETTLANLVLETKALSYNFADLKKTKEISESYNKIIPLRDKMKALASTVYASNTYLKNVTDVLEEYAKLTDDEKVFFNSALVYNLENAKKNVADQLEFYKTYYKYDLNKMNNESIYELLSVYNKLKINSSLLSNEIGQDNYTKLIGLGSSVDYSKFDTIVPKIKGDNEKEWGLTSDDVKELKCIIQLAKIDSSVYNNVLLKCMVAGITLDLNTLETKLNNLTSIG